MKIDPKDCIIDFHDGQFWCYALNIVYPAYFMPFPGSPRHIRIHTMGDDEAASGFNGFETPRFSDRAEVMLNLLS